MCYYVSKRIKSSIKDTSSSDVSKRIKTFDTFFDTAFGPDGMDGDDASRRKGASGWEGARR